MAGPKKRITAAPLDLSGLPKGRAARRIAFIEQFCLVPKGFGAGEPVKLRPFQKTIIRGAFGKGIRTGLLSLPRGNGKTSLAAMLGLAELFAGPESAEVLVVASDQRQASITFNQARRMIELNPVLAERVYVYQDKLTLPERNASLVPLPAHPDALAGYDPSLLVVDELAVVTRDTWEAVTSAAGKRPESLTLAISTPAASEDSLMWDLVKHGRSGSDPSFWLKEYAAPEGCDLDDREAWKIANPAAACKPPFLDLSGLEAVRRTMREPAFRQLRLGQWVAGIDQWLPFGAFEALEDRSRAVEGPVVFGFDGSASGDSTALVGCTVGDDPHIWVEGLWQNPGSKQWRVPRAEVSAAVDAAFEKYDVREMACDPWHYRAEIEAWAGRHGQRRVIEWNTGFRKRMAPATDRMYQAVLGKTFTHDGNPELVAHFAHAVATRTPQGDVITKETRNSSKKIDAAVAAIVALDRAAFHSQKRRGRVVVHGRTR